jgi:hypothetical protein
MHASRGQWQWAREPYVFNCCLLACFHGLWAHDDRPTSAVLDRQDSLKWDCWKAQAIEYLPIGTVRRVASTTLACTTYQAIGNYICIYGTIEATCQRTRRHHCPWPFLGKSRVMSSSHPCTQWKLSSSMLCRERPWRYLVHAWIRPTVWRVSNVGFARSIYYLHHLLTPSPMRVGEAIVALLFVFFFFFFPSLLNLNLLIWSLLHMGRQRGVATGRPRFNYLTAKLTV